MSCSRREAAGRTLGDRACFGVDADREALPDAETLAAGIDTAISEGLARAAEQQPCRT